MSINQSDILSSLRENLGGEAFDKVKRLFSLISAENPNTEPEDIHHLDVFLLRISFCFYAEDAGLFAPNQFTSTISSFTQKDGCDLAAFFTRLFYVLSRPCDTNTRAVLQSQYTGFPYVNGTLFTSDAPVPELSGSARSLLVECGALDWSEVDPAVFSSPLQPMIYTEQCICTKE